MRYGLTLLLALLCACSGGDPKALTDEGSKALNSGDAKGALSAFDRALEKMQDGDPNLLRARVGRCEALARIDPERAQTEFLMLANLDVREQDYVAVATELVRRNAIGPAVAIAESGMTRFPGSPAMKSLRDTVGDAAKKASDPEALKKLKGLGYAGDG